MTFPIQIKWDRYYEQEIVLFVALNSLRHFAVTLTKTILPWSSLTLLINLHLQQNLKLQIRINTYALG